MTYLHAQSTLLASGGKASGSSGSVTYSVGQITYKSFGNTNGSVSQGVLQPTLVITALESGVNEEISCIVFPNPTSTTVNLKIENRSLENVFFQLYDLNGQLLQDQKVNATNTSISTENLANTTYLLKVRDGNLELKTFKIIKN